MAYNPQPPSCPLCNSAMRGHSTRNGTIWACVRSPDCSGTIRHLKNDPQKQEKKRKNA